MEGPPSVSVISCPHGSTVGIKCANAIILSISSTFSSSVSECCFCGSSCRICSTKWGAEGTGSDAFAVSIAGDVDFFGSCLAMGFFGVSGSLCASLRVPFAVTGLFFVKAALAVAYLRTQSEGVRARHALTLDDETIPWRLETPPKYVREMPRAIDTANDEKEVLQKARISAKGNQAVCTCLASATSHASGNATRNFS